MKVQKSSLHVFVTTSFVCLFDLKIKFKKGITTKNMMYIFFISITWTFITSMFQNQNFISARSIYCDLVHVSTKIFAEKEKFLCINVYNIAVKNEWSCSNHVLLKKNICLDKSNLKIFTLPIAILCYKLCKRHQLTNSTSKKFYQS